ncbi:aminoglycoside phosphotransferase family protein [Pseudonocardia sp. DR1-2]|uniref:phosphotransferase n=1 Tax=Pseudonocardia sp. DR1-2 TaxID=2951168 RepID=UPI002042E333|nr:phosphotransferase [Pseudonocardia sp. DR1-2]MCM3848599.1 aminoglycoside phosphotransferase family protein [Pseudonocardia sp. DR1-2]
MTPLHPDIARAAHARWPDRAPAWIEALPAELAEVCAALSVTPTGRTFSARSAHVVEATTGAGTRLVLRSSADPDAVHQAAVLDQLARAGLAPAVHLLRDTPTSTWTAMDAVEPGASFAEQEPRPRDLAGIAAMLRTLSNEEGAHSVPSIVPWLRARLSDPPADDQPPHRGPEPAVVREAASVVLDELAAEMLAGLCHADLSPPNVLHGNSRLWFIDPRGMNGEAAYDVAVLALKLSDDHLDTARALARSIALSSGTDPDRADAWVTVVDAATV